MKRNRGVSLPRSFLNSLSPRRGAGFDFISIMIIKIRSKQAMERVPAL